ncbi:MAG: potassium channel protein [Rhodobacterales bacterium]|nr:MAG: potassium channel protein [Rhodobacterales bacterium]
MRLTHLGSLTGGIAEAFRDPRIRILLAMTTTLIAGAAVFYRWAEGWSWLDSIYFSVITIATVGYGDFSPVTVAGKLFTIFYVLCGLGLFVATATAIADRIISRVDLSGER